MQSLPRLFVELVQMIIILMNFVVLFIDQANCNCFDLQLGLIITKILDLITILFAVQGLLGSLNPPTKVSKLGFVGIIFLQILILVGINVVTAGQWSANGIPLLINITVVNIALASLGITMMFFIRAFSEIKLDITTPN